MSDHDERCRCAQCLLSGDSVDCLDYASPQPAQGSPSGTSSVADLKMNTSREWICGKAAQEVWYYTFVVNGHTYMTAKSTISVGDVRSIAGVPSSHAIYIENLDSPDKLFCGEQSVYLADGGEFYGQALQEWIPKFITCDKCTGEQSSPCHDAHSFQEMAEIVKDSQPTSEPSRFNSSHCKACGKENPNGGRDNEIWFCSYECYCDD